MGDKRPPSASTGGVYPLPPRDQSPGSGIGWRPPGLAKASMLQRVTFGSSLSRELAALTHQCLPESLAIPKFGGTNRRFGLEGKRLTPGRAGTMLSAERVVPVCPLPVVPAGATHDFLFSHVWERIKDMKRARLGFLAVAVGLGMSLFAMQGVAEARCRRCRVRCCPAPCCCYYSCCPAPSCCNDIGCGCTPGFAPQSDAPTAPSGTADVDRSGPTVQVRGETVITQPAPQSTK